MSGFLATVWSNLRALPVNLARGFRPGTAADDLAPRRMRRNFLYHIHPLQVSQVALRTATTLGLGVISLTLFFLLTVSGVLLMIYYLPAVREAHGSMQDIQYVVTFGAFLRSLHRFGAHAMVAVVLLHLLRVVFSGSYFRRELNWTFGLILLLLTLGLAFTGYLLPWDQLSYWAVAVVSSMLDNVPLVGAWLKDLLLGGQVIGPATLLRFYALHVAILPLAMVLLVALHLWRIRKDGGLAASAGATEFVPAWPHLVLREAILVVLVIAILSLVATLVDAPLGASPNYHLPDNPEKAPWYFLWVQEMVSYSAAVGGFLFPCLLAVGAFLLPFLERSGQSPGRFLGIPACRRAVSGVLPLALALVCLFEAVYLQPDFGRYLARSAPWLQDLLNPATGMLLCAFGSSFFVGWKTGSTRDALIAGMTVLTVAVIGFTVVGLCRGPDWVFFWPWKGWTTGP